MKHLVEFPLSDDSGTTVLVEVDEPETEGTTPVGLFGDKIERSKKGIEDSLNKVWPSIEQITNKLREMANEPDEFEIGFGIKLNTKVGAFLASAGTEANFNVRVMWSSEAKQSKP